MDRAYVNLVDQNLAETDSYCKLKYHQSRPNKYNNYVTRIVFLSFHLSNILKQFENIPSLIDSIIPNEEF